MFYFNDIICNGLHVNWIWAALLVMYVDEIFLSSSKVMFIPPYLLYSVRFLSTPIILH